jgi:hypothetical protein
MGNHQLKHRTTRGSLVEQLEPDSWRLTIPSGTGKSYNWVQLDDYLDLPRSRFLWQKPVRMECRARISNHNLPGTWGFGFWNDPFNASLGIRGTAARMPALPNAAWFFFASPENHLTLSTNSPGQGFLATVFQSPLIPAGLLIPGYLALPALIIPSAARWLRKTASRVIKDQSYKIEVAVTNWNSYRLEILADRTNFFVNDRLIYSPVIAPVGKLGVVIWIDNQYASFRPDGKIQAGLLENTQPAWMEIKDLKIEKIT